jgi:hypothetical protein
VSSSQTSSSPSSAPKIVAGTDAPGRLIAAREQDPRDLALEMGITELDWTKWPVVAVRSSRSPVEASIIGENDEVLATPLTAGEILTRPLLEGDVVRPALWGACVAQLKGNVPQGIRNFVLACTWKAFEEQTVDLSHLRVEVGVHRRNLGSNQPAVKVLEQEILPAKQGANKRFVVMRVMEKGR